jgi:putative tryptophan/tyrosine transport system substrate-binding protein
MFAPASSAAFVGSRPQRPCSADAPGATILAAVNRRAFVTGLGAVLAAPRAAGAQHAGKMYRLGYLSPAYPTSGEDPQSDLPPTPYRATLREQLRQYGWVEGRNLSIEYRFARGDLKRLPDLVAELIGLPADVIFSETGTAAMAAVKATRVIPIVFSAGDAVAQGLTSSLARPDRNATGLSVLSTDISPKRLELLKEALPRITRVAVMRCVGSKIDERDWQQTERAANLLRLRLLPLDIRSREDVDAAFATATKQADALFVLDCALFNALGPAVMSQSRIPAMYALNQYAREGGLMAYGRDSDENARRAAWYIDKILRGARPKDLPIEEPTKFVLTINLKTAKALGLTIPPSVLLRADQVIE